MKTMLEYRSLTASALVAAALALPGVADATPKVSRLTPPSALFTYNDPGAPYIARFLPGQRFDLQTTVQPDSGQSITNIQFYVDEKAVSQPIAYGPATVSGLAPNTTIATARAFASSKKGSVRCGARQLRDR
jgi:alkaline phosphatase